MTTRPYCTAVGPRYHASVDATAPSRRGRGDAGRAARHRRRRRRCDPGLSPATLASAAGASRPAARPLLAAGGLAPPLGARDLSLPAYPHLSPVPPIRA